MTRNPEAFARSRQKWLERGYKPSREVFIERTVRTTRSGTRRDNGVTLTQSSGESNAEGEILFWSYEGAGYTWQGTIYVEIYADNSASTWDGQIDTSTEDHPWVFQEMTWSGGGAGDRDRDHRIESFSSPPLPGYLTRSGGNIQLVNERTGFGANKGMSILPVRSFYEWAVCWRTAVVSGCTAAAIGCLRVTAAWPACFAMWCIGAEVGGAVGCAMAL